MTRQIVTRVILLLIAAGSLYLLLPQVLDVFSSWPQLRGIKSALARPRRVFEALSFVALWTLQRIAVGTRSWFAVGTSQLAANAAGSIVPGGGAGSGAVQYGMLVRSGVPGERVASGLTASAAATTAAVFALPVVALLAGIGEVAAPEGLRKVAYSGRLRLSCSASRSSRRWPGTRRCWRSAEAPGQRQDGSASASASRISPRSSWCSATGSAEPSRSTRSSPRWRHSASGASTTSPCCACCRGSASRPSRHSYSSPTPLPPLLALIPLTPGGLGFVEAGLTGLLVLAGVGAGDAAAATLAYRLVSYWLPLPVGLVAYLLGRHRYGSGAPPPDLGAAHL